MWREARRIEEVFKRVDERLCLRLIVVAVKDMDRVVDQQIACLSLDGVDFSNFLVLKK